MFFDTKYRELFSKKKVYLFVSFVVMLFVLTPNVLWNINNDWVTFSHTSDNAALSKININLFRGFEFILSQILMVGPILFFAFLIFIKKIRITFQTKFLFIFTIPIFVIILFESILVRANANWSAVAIVAFIILMVHLLYLISKKVVLINIIFNFTVGLVFFGLIATTSSLDVFNRISGISSFAENLKKNEGEAIKTLVISDRLLFSNLSYLLRNIDVDFYTPYKLGSEITNHFQLTSPLPKSINKNFIFIGHTEQLKYLENDYKLINLESKREKFKSEPIEVYEVIF